MRKVVSMVELKIIRMLLTLCIVFSVLVGCGGQDGTGRPNSGGAAEKSVTSIGSVTSENTFTVNGIEYDTAAAEILIDNEPSELGNSALGQIAIVNGILNQDGQTGIATTINFNANVFGPVEEINYADQYFRILGQTIHMTRDTIYVGEQLLTMHDIREGYSLRVMGYVLAGGNLFASYIERIVLDEAVRPGEGGNPFYEVNGRISNLNIDSMTFEINGFMIDYSNIVMLEVLENGMQVEVLGAEVNDNDKFIAAAVNVLRIELPDPDTRIELEGFVTQFQALNDFEINGVRIRADINDTVFVGGASDAVDVNRQIEVEGYFDNDGVLVAERVIIVASFLTSHEHGDQLNSDTVTFVWADVDADEYQLVIVNNQNTIFSEYFDGRITSATISNLPVNEAFLSVEIATRRGSLWQAQAYAIISSDVLPNAELLIHHDGDILTSPEVDFRWTDVDADEYRIYVESNGNIIHDQIYDRGTISALVENLPANGAEIFFLLYTRHGDGWAFRVYNFISQNALDNAYLLSHVDGDVLNSDSVMLTWADVNADSYQLEIYSHSNELFSQSFDGQITSAFVEGLPINGAELRVVLTTMHGQGSVSRTTYLTSQEILEVSTFLDHTDGDVFTTKDIELHWANVNADEYRIDIREDVENGYLVYSERFDNQATSTLIKYLPNDGERLFFRLSTRHGQGWADRHYEFSIIAED